MHPHALYVDDEQAIVNLAQRVLESAGIRVTGETDSTRAWKEFQAAPHDFDVVYSDRTMPEMNGFELVAKVRTLRPDIPVFMVSSGILDGEEQLMVDLRIEDLIVKPEIIPGLRRTVAQLKSRPGRFHT